jgi:hypothetical protein
MNLYSVNCVCECNKLHTTDFQALKRSKVKSCGCLNKEVATKNMTKHGLCMKNGKKTSEYVTWIKMKHRCFNINSKDYIHYGGRGITVCEEWKNSFETFLKDIGEKPSIDYSLERIDVNGNYESSNCKWILKKDQPKNTRFVQPFEYQGIKKSLPEWAEYLKLSYGMLRYRIYDLKLTFEEAITIPKGKKLKNIYH